MDLGARDFLKIKLHDPHLTALQHDLLLSQRLPLLLWLDGASNKHSEEGAYYLTFGTRKRRALFKIRNRELFLIAEVIGCQKKFRAAKINTLPFRLNVLLGNTFVLFSDL